MTPETARLLQHWRHHQFDNLRPFFCQIEAVETAIWLAEVASDRAAAGARIWSHIRGANKEANPELLRIALKLATGAGKTTVMAMLIAWQTINALRRAQSGRFSRAFLVITPGITIKDRLRVLLPNDPNSYYRERELVPPDMLDDIRKAKIVITNYHGFRRRERVEVSKTGRALLQGRGPELQTLETEGEMLRRAVGDLMGLKNIVVLNDEAHHCYREKPQAEDGEKLKGEDKEEAKKNSEAARLWISGIETVKRKLGLAAVYDLSATPFFLRGSGYIEGTLFPWTVSDFSLMDAIECGIVKLPRVPVADNIPGGDMPKFRNLWDHLRGSDLPKKGRSKSGPLDPLKIPALLQTALEALYGHYAKTFALWQEAGIAVPPVFIIVCNNTATSKLVYDYISGFAQKNDDGTETFIPGHFELFRNQDEHGNRLPRPRTLLIDSEQLESGEALDKGFRDMAADEQRLGELGCARMSTRTSRRRIYDKFAHGQVAVNLRACRSLTGLVVRNPQMRKIYRPTSFATADQDAVRKSADAENRTPPDSIFATAWPEIRGCGKPATPPDSRRHFDSQRLDANSADAENASPPDSRQHFDIWQFATA